MSDPTNLSQKFAALQQLMMTQHTALLSEIAALRGTGGPETTLRSINQSIWALAGAAPGATLAQLKAAIEALAGGKSLAALWNQWTPGAGTPYALLESSDTALQQLKALWSPQGEGPSAYDLLNNLYQAILANGLTETDAKAILTRIIAQLDTNTVTPTIKDLLMTMSDQQAKIAANTGSPFDSPVGCCETPVRSTGTSYVTISGNMIEPFTAATWPETIGGDFSTSYTIGTLSYSAIHCTDWTQYKIYVASEGTDWGIFGPSPQRQPTNQWLPGTVVTNNPHFLIAQDINFIVQGAMRLDVYICPIAQNSAPSLDGLPWLRQVGWSYLGIYTSAGNIQSKVYEPIFTTAPTATIGAYTLEFVSNPDGTRQIIGVGNQTPLKVHIGWNVTGRIYPGWVYSRSRFIAIQGQFIPINDEPWRSMTTQQPIGTSYDVHDVVGDTVEFVVFYGIDDPAPTHLDYFLSAGT
jgi:hypothetical protein